MVQNFTSEQPSGAEYLRAVLSSKVYELAQITPLQEMAKLSARSGNHILVKREDRQPVHSFKLRGAYAISCSGVICASS